MRASNRDTNSLGIWRGKALLRLLLLLGAAAAVDAFAASFGISRNYAHLHASLLSGAPGRLLYHRHSVGDAGQTRAWQTPRRAHSRFDRESRSPDRRWAARRGGLRPGSGRHTRAGGCRPRIVGSASRAGVPAAPRATGPPVSYLRRFAGKIDRDRS